MESNDRIIDRLLDGHDKHVYYLLSVSASCIAFALFQTKDSVLTKNEIPLGLAVLLWGLSFISGCQKILYGIKIHERQLYINLYKAILDKQGHSLLSDGEWQKTWDEVMSLNKKARRHFRWQFLLIILGAVCYISWHILEMSARAK